MTLLIIGLLQPFIVLEDSHVPKP